MKKIYVFLAFILFPLIVFSQEKGLLDSLNRQLIAHDERKSKTSEDITPLFDSTKAKILFSISKAYLEMILKKQSITHIN
ncbi:MAG: hypothetical protein IPK10_03670 [Bacteroidetes bacterium]|nr:hypothetical protein [Bacteroidota bacterium]